ncbi:hypothetical protein [Kineococcus radiotolerans]|uniref:Uncharacterized protein n=1 Tax=Kineococcus radiotolerans (strain ATCC BAA-149 / DSM 14245 / SRS30216) TaxID=266940 RepID=A6WCV5_KINRD|nr:hypothetical protein [Kineococcus radiotolerans]ABS04644.1 hypothetical protein Krad_3180 [Kineococcus radiotolerans SRS30216 = ATCC BAA-149]
MSEQVPGGDPDFDFDAEFEKAFGPKPPVRSVLVVPVANARKLAEVCTAAGVNAFVVPVKGLGCVLVTEDPATGEADAGTLSRLLQGAEVVLLTVGEDSIEGQTWAGGRRGEDPRPGLLLSVWPDVVQQLVLGRLDPAEAAGAAAGGDGSRIGAFWKLFRSRSEDGPTAPGAGDPDGPR